MSRSRKIAAAAVAVAAVLAGLVVTAPSAQAQVPPQAVCLYGSDPNRFSDPETVGRVAEAGRQIELRYSRSTRCAWGRISAGEPGDLIWVDWSDNGGSTWVQLGVNRINNGRTQFTPAYDDAGNVMRACGQPRDYRVVCTRWY